MHIAPTLRRRSAYSLLPSSPSTHPQRNLRHCLNNKHLTGLPMASQAQLLPQLFALLPVEQLELMLSRLSLMALHVEGYTIRDDLFLATNPVLPGPNRILRMRARRRRRRKGASAPPLRWAGAMDLGNEKVDGWDYSLSWVSPALSGREYAEMRVQAIIGLEVEGMSERAEIEDFVQALGFKHSHTYSRMGHLFHLPIPGQSATLHLMVTRVLGPDDKPAAHVSEPYLVQLQPGRPVGAVAARGEVNLQDMMRVMRDVADRIDGLQWETGR